MSRGMAHLELCADGEDNTSALDAIVLLRSPDLEAARMVDAVGDTVLGGPLEITLGRRQDLGQGVELSQILRARMQRALLCALRRQGTAGNLVFLRPCCREQLPCRPWLEVGTEELLLTLFTDETLLRDEVPQALHVLSAGVWRHKAYALLTAITHFGVEDGLQQFAVLLGEDGQVTVDTSEEGSADNDTSIGVTP